MRFLTLCLLSVWASANAQRIWINQVEGYSQLNSCAEPPLSAVVRGMSSGCWDNGDVTSYDCFCYASSSKFASIISTDVLKGCPDSTADADSATDVFSAYCQVRATMTTASSTTEEDSSSASDEPSSTSAPSTTPPISTTSSSSPSTLSLSSQPTTPPPNLPTTSTPSPPALPATSNDTASLSKTTLIAIITIITILAASLTSLALWWFCRHRRTQKQPKIPPPYSQHGVPPGAAMSTARSEDMQELTAWNAVMEKMNDRTFHELDDSSRAGTADGSTVGGYRAEKTVELPVGSGHVGDMVKDSQGHARVRSRTVRHSVQELL